MVAVLIGLGLIGVRTLYLLKVFRALPFWQVLLLGYGFIPALISIVGFSQIGTVLPVAQVICAIAALYAFSKIIIHRRNIMQQARYRLQTKTGIAILLLALAGTGVFVTAQWCYFEGGINNLDQFRGLGFIAGFSANSLKPAHPLDLSIPISYGYYFYMYPALVYSGIAGHAWPSALLVTSAIFAIGWFYFLFMKFVELFLPKLFSAWQIFAAMALTFYGLDFVLHVPYSSDWWNPLQITQMAAYWHWLYHYLFAAALGFSSLICLSQAFANRRGSSALAAILFAIMTPLYSSITGIFFAVIFLTYYALMCLTDWRRLLFWYAFNLTPAYFVTFFFAFVILFVPQAFTFLGHQSFLVAHAMPVSWFTQQPVFSLSANDWHLFFLTLLTEFGPLHCLSLFLVPALIYKLYKNKHENAALLCAFAIITVGSITFFSSENHDWNWRTGNFGLIILSTVPAMWGLSRLSEFNYRHQNKMKFFVLIFFIPGAASYAYETQQRFAYCVPAGEAARVINQNVPLKSVISYTTKPQKTLIPYNIHNDHIWWHTVTSLTPSRFAMENEQEAILSLSIQAGRAAYGYNNPTWKLLYVYLADENMMEKYLNWKKNHPPCMPTRYGASVPNQNYIEADNIYDKAKFTWIACKN